MEELGQEMRVGEHDQDQGSGDSDHGTIRRDEKDIESQVKKKRGIHALARGRFGNCYLPSCTCFGLAQFSMCRSLGFQT